MDLSGTTLQLDRAGLAVRHEALSARVADLAAEQHALAQAVGPVLEGWRGDAADAFRAYWQDWRDGAQGVVAAIGADLDAVTLACAEIVGSDTASEASSARLIGRLG